MSPSSRAWGLTRNGARASRVTTHGLMVEAKFLALKAAKGKSSPRCTSRASHGQFARKRIASGGKEAGKPT